MKQAFVAALGVLAVAAGFVLWIAADIAPRADPVLHAEPPQAAEINYLRAV